MRQEAGEEGRGGEGCKVGCKGSLKSRSNRTGLKAQKGGVEGDLNVVVVAVWEEAGEEGRGGEGWKVESKGSLYKVEAVERG